MNEHRNASCKATMDIKDSQMKQNANQLSYRIEHGVMYVTEAFDSGPAQKEKYATSSG